MKLNEGGNVVPNAVELQKANFPLVMANLKKIGYLTEQLHVTLPQLEELAVKTLSQKLFYNMKINLLQEHKTTQGLHQTMQVMQLQIY